MQSSNSNSISYHMAIKLIEDALFCTTSKALSYSDPDQKWIIRKHLISLIQDYPSLKPSVDIFTHNDGSEVKLLYVQGELRVSPNMPEVPIIIWVPELYPQVPPIVYVSSLDNSMYPIYENHPYVDSSSGATTSCYMNDWKSNKCNLTDLVRNLRKLFSVNHPFYYSSSSSSSHPSMVSKREAIDSLVNVIYYDSITIRSKNEEEIENMAAVQAELRKRGETADMLVFGLDHEHKSLIGRIHELSNESDKLLSWLKVYENYSVCSMLGGEIENAFETLDKKSEIELELQAADNAIEDVIYGLEKAVEQGIINFQVYIRHVRLLAREQFYNRAKIVEVEKM